MRYLKLSGWLLLAVILAAAALFTAGVLWPEDELAPVRTHGPLAIVDVTIVDVRRGTTIPRQTVVIEGGLIRAAGNGPPPRARHAFDARNRVIRSSPAPTTSVKDVRNTQRIRAVVFNGNFYDRAALDGIERGVERRARSWSVGRKIVWRFLKKPAGY